MPGRTMRISSLSGKLLQAHAFITPERRLGRTLWMPGIYLVTAPDGDQQVQYKIIKQ